MAVAVSRNGRRSGVYVHGTYGSGLHSGQHSTAQHSTGQSRITRKALTTGRPRLPTRGETYYLPANPVIGVIEGVSFPLKQLSEQCSQVFVVWLLEEVQPPDVAQVGCHLL